MGGNVIGGVGSGGNGGFAAGGGLNIVGGLAIITTMTLSNSNLFGGLGGDGGEAQQSGMGGDGGNGGSALGAGIFNSFSELTLVNGTVSVNEAHGGSGGVGGLNGINQGGVGGAGGTAQGGGLYQLSGIASISSSTLDHNAAFGGITFSILPNVQAPDASGGGLFIYFGTVKVTNSTIAFNQTFETDVNQQQHIAGEGGGLRNIQAAVQLTNDTISGNASGVGGGVWTQDLTLVNTLIARNFDSFGDPDFHTQPGGNINDLGHNLIGNGGLSIGFFSTMKGDIVGTPAKPIDPMLGPLAFNGGPTQTLALLPGSLAIDHGQTPVTDPITGQPLTTDQRGFHRPHGIGPTPANDIGAFEFYGGKMKRPPNPQSVPASNLQPLQAITDAIPAPPVDRQF
jgi:hypothetical protein